VILNEGKKFAYENLKVWNKPVDFAVQVVDTVEEMPTGRKHYRLLEQIESSSSSISMNVAEGKGRHSKKEYTQYLYISRGSLYETMTLLEILRRKGWISNNRYETFQSHGIEIASTLKGLINLLR
jgi:four helix bundle protein